MVYPNLSSIIDTMAIMEDTVFDSEDARLEESRDYQREMLQESLRKNIILAVRRPLPMLLLMLTTYRWTLAVARPICTSILELL